MREKQTIEISTGIVFRTILLLLALWFLYVIRDIIFLLFISIIIVAVIDPAVDWMQKKGVPRALGVILMFIFIFAIVAASISLLIPPLIAQFKDFSANFSNYSAGVEHYFQGANSYFQTQNSSLDVQKITSGFSNTLADIPSNILSTTIGVFSGLIAILIIFSLAFYMTVRENGIRRFIMLITPEGHREYAVSLFERIKVKIGKWMQGQLLLMLIIFILDFIGLYIIGVPYALSLALFAGIMEVVPYVGPIISAVPGVIIGFLISPVTGILVLLLYIITQQFEGNIIVPQVMKRTVGLNPIGVILALLAGAKIGGVLGAIIAIPAATAVSVFLGDFFEKKS